MDLNKTKNIFIYNMPLSNQSEMFDLICEYVEKEEAENGITAPNDSLVAVRDNPATMTKQVRISWHEEGFLHANLFSDPSDEMWRLSEIRGDK